MEWPQAALSHHLASVMCLLLPRSLSNVWLAARQEEDAPTRRKRANVGRSRKRSWQPSRRAAAASRTNRACCDVPAPLIVMKRRRGRCVRVGVKPPEAASAAASGSVHRRRLRAEVGGELGEHGRHGLVELGAEDARLENLVEDGLVVCLDEGEQLLLVRPDVGDGELVEEAARAGVDADNLLLEGHRHVLVLLEHLLQPRAAVEQVLGGGVEVGAELGEGGDLAVLGELELEGARNLLHGLALRGGAYARDGEADVDRRADAAVEELGLKEDLAVSDGDHVGWDVGGHVASLGLDDGERGHGAAEHLLGHLGGALEEARVQVEDVAGVGLATGRAAEQQRHLAVGDGLLGQVVEDDEGVHAVVAEVLANGAAGVRREEL
mmetsp:Transcript_24932/g.52180  ORF Transcript_24932/g.52180 Transcript_24932/m.52180 type:complete len:380 (+) Transcript_24932:270-1409(+)